jgi:hypothetical protein
MLQGKPDGPQLLSPGFFIASWSMMGETAEGKDTLSEEFTQKNQPLA